jgi:tryptophan synthase alpha chain
MPFLTGGYPTLHRSEEMLEALVAGGADLLELGVPFSDPMADGTTVQKTSQVALDQGTSLADCIAMVKRAREKGITVPIVLMGYANPFLHYGIEKFAADAAAAGVDGAIVPDLPLEEADEFAIPLRERGLDLVFMIAPTSTQHRIEEVAKKASGFIYCVSLTGVTGARSNLAADLEEYFARIRAATDTPLAIGFGISTPDHVREVSKLADGVIVASALINYVDQLPEAEQAAGATGFVRDLAAATWHDQSSQR